MEADSKPPFITRVFSKLNSAFNLSGSGIEKGSRRGGLSFRNVPLPFNSYVQMVGCITEGSEIFTKEGWKPVEEVEDDDELYSIDPSTREGKFYPIKEKFVYDYDGVLLKNGVGLTNEHKMLVYYGEKFKSVQLKNLKSGRMLVTAGNYNGGIVPEDFVYNVYQGNRWGKVSIRKTKKIEAKDWFEFLGWFVSEGHLGSRDGEWQVRLTQYKEEGRRKIETMLKRMGISIIHSGKQYVIKSKDIYLWLENNCYVEKPYNSHTKKIPEIVKTSSKEYMNIFLNSYIDGDGYREKSGSIVFSTASEKLAEDLEEMGILSGYSISRSISEGEKSFVRSSGESYVLVYKQFVGRFKVRNYIDVRSWLKKSEYEYYRGKVYDFNIEPYHTLFVRGRNSIGDFIYLVTYNSNEKTPLYRWGYSWVMDLFYGSDILRTVIKNLNDEIFKNGISVEEKFVKKCINPRCGYEVFEDIDKCPLCFSQMRSPDLSQKLRAEAFIKKKNRFDENTINTMKSSDLDVNIFDNAFLLLTRRYTYDESGRIIGAEIDDLVRLSPDKVKLVLSNYGMGRGDTGSYLYVCPEHREKINIKPDKKEYFCDIDGKELIECWFAANPSGSAGSGASGQNLYFGRGEIYHVKRWSSQEGYGVSMVYTIWRKVLTLIKMDDYTLEAYSLQRTPRSFLVIRGKLENIRQAFMWLSNKARENPNMIYPLVVEGTDAGARRIVEQVNMDLKPDEMQMLDMVELFRTHIGLMYGVQPIMSGGNGSSGGLNNEGLQVTVTNRTINESQRVWNGFLEWLASKLNITDFILKLKPNELEDDMRKLEMESTRIEQAINMSKIGFDVDMEIDKDGMMKFRYHKISLSPETGESSIGEGNNVDLDNLEGGGQLSPVEQREAQEAENANVNNAERNSEQ